MKLSTATAVVAASLPQHTNRAETTQLTAIPPVYIYWYVCVFFTLNRSFYPSTSSATSIRADLSILEEIPWYKLCGHKATPQIDYVATYAVSTAVGNAMPCHRTRYDRHDTHNL